MGLFVKVTFDAAFCASALTFCAGIVIRNNQGNVM